MNDEWSGIAANAIIYEAKMTGAIWQEAAAEHKRPSVLYRPAISMDGNKWCVLYGADLMDGVAGFGDSPDEAMRAFDAAWYAALQSHQEGK